MSVQPVQHSVCTQAAGCELLRSKINRGQEEHHCASSGWGTRQRRRNQTYVQRPFVTIPGLLISIQDLLAEIIEAMGRSEPQFNPLGL